VVKRVLVVSIVGYWDLEWAYEYPLAFNSSAFSRVGGDTSPL